ncbi:MAG: hypothetical protein ACR2HW_06420 [Gemmatimonadales bacterium]
MFVMHDVEGYTHEEIASSLGPRLPVPRRSGQLTRDVRAQVDPPWAPVRSWRLNLAGFRSYNYGGDVTWTGLFLTGLYELGISPLADGSWPSIRARSATGGPEVGRSWLTSPAGSGTFSSSPTRTSAGSTAPVSMAIITAVTGSELDRLGCSRVEGGCTVVAESGASDRANRDISTVCGHVRRPGGNKHVRASLCVCRSGPDHCLRQCPAQLDIYPEIEPRGVCPAAAVVGAVHRVQGAGPATKLRLTAYPDPVPTDDPDRIVVDPDGAGGSGVGEEIDDPNFSLASLRGNAVLRWEYSAGSTLFLIWTQNRSDTETIGTFRTGRTLDRLVGAAGENIFLLKLSYWWNP